mgnify:CR=1 FL=1
MTDTNAFTKLVPGFDFLQGLVKNAGTALPSIGQWVAPTLNPEELEKRIEELRTVQFWLEQNARMLGATIVGPRASEMISFFTLAITERISLYKLFRLVYPYPTLSGAIQKIADEFVRKTLPNLPAELRAVARYGAATIWGRLRGASFEAAWPGASPPGSSTSPR